jgi:hypothetical protein
LNEEEFRRLFEILTDNPEYLGAIRLASRQGENFLSAQELHTFLTEEQGFKVEKKTIDAIIDEFEPGAEGRKEKILSLNGWQWTRNKAIRYMHFKIKDFATCCILNGDI